MALLQRGVAVVTNRMPKVLSPRGHAIADYATIGMFALMTAVFWKRNRRAAISALLSGLAETGTVLLTNFPGGVVRVIDFPTHGKIDMGLGAATFTMPNLLGFDDEPEAKFFRMMGLNVTAVTGLTDFEGKQPELRRRAA